MAKVIWKFPLTTDEGQVIDEGHISMPAGARLLHVEAPIVWSVAFGPRNLAICVWAEVDPDSPVVTRNLAIIPTGLQEVPSSAEYVGTFLMVSGLVFHLYDRGETEKGGVM